MRMSALCHRLLPVTPLLCSSLDRWLNFTCSLHYKTHQEGPIAASPEPWLDHTALETCHLGTRCQGLGLLSPCIFLTPSHCSLIPPLNYGINSHMKSSILSTVTSTECCITTTNITLLTQACFRQIHDSRRLVTGWKMLSQNHNYCRYL